MSYARGVVLAQVLTYIRGNEGGARASADDDERSRGPLASIEQEKPLGEAAKVKVRQVRRCLYA
ncbi:MAG TPA: hypothetical protein VFU02_14215 [Polyangiaceae bacterium]|nr:hypothetical protein [Polyangiaceae bacterium]